MLRTVDRLVRLALVVGVGLVGVSCGSDEATGPRPPEARFGETTFVVIVNPAVNDANDMAVPAPGSVRQGVSVVADDGTSATTDASGIAVLSDVAPGTRTIILSGGGDSGEITVSIAQADLREVAVALDGSGAAVMSNVRYRFGGQVVELTPFTPLAEVNNALAQSNIIVFFRGGVYSGDLTFSGSSVTLFGEGALGGQVTINGNVIVEGSSNRIRGAVVNGDLSVPGSDPGISFALVAGAFDLSGSSAVLLNNALCGSASITGSNPTALGNAGLTPIPAAAGGC